MTGNALMDFIIALVVLAGALAIMWAALSYLSQDPTFVKIARIAIGVVAVVVFLLAVKAVLFGGGPALLASPLGVIYFAIAVIVVLVVVYIVKAFITWAEIPFGDQINYVLGAIALIAFLYAAAVFLFGGGTMGVGKMRLSQPYAVQALI